MNALIEAALTRSRTVMACLALVLIAGLTAYMTIPRESDPDITLPLIFVNVNHDGISPEDSERLIIKPIEKEVQSIPGIKKMNSTARVGGAWITIEFHSDVDVPRALADVRDKVDIAKAELPADADEPIVEELATSDFPIVVVTLFGSLPERTLLHLAQNLQDDIEAIPSVLEASLTGIREEVLEVNIDTAKLESYNITQDELLRVVQRNNQVVAAGTLDTGQGRFAVKVPGLFETALDVLELPVKVDGDAVVKLSDVAQIRRTFKDAATMSRLNGRPAVGVEIKKRTGANIVDTVAAVRNLVSEHEARWPAGLQVFYSQDQSVAVLENVSQLQNSVITAILLVVIVIVFVMGARAAALVGMAIPTSFLFGILVIAALGLTLNQVVLFALVLAVGLLVDGAIVVTEYADRKLAEGLPRREAYALAAKRMAWPITASVATTLAAFLPLLAWPDIMGEFMQYLPITLVATLVGSLLAALIFLPTLGAIMGRTETRKADTLAGLAAVEFGDTRGLPGLTGSYARLLSRLILKPFLVLGVAFIMLISVWGWYATHGDGVQFFPEGDSSIIQLEVRARGNLAILEKNELVKEVEAAIAEVDGIYATYTVVGGNTGASGGFGNEPAADRIGVISLQLRDWRLRPRSDAIIEQIRRLTQPIAGIYVTPSQLDFGPDQGKDVQLEVSAPLPSLINSTVERIRAYMDSDVDGLLDIDDTRPLPGIEWKLTVDRAQAERFGADVATVGGVVQLVTNGVKVGEYRPDDADEEIEIRVRFPEDERSMAMLDELRVNSAEGPIPISNFVTRSARQQVNTIERINGARVLKISANVAPGYFTDTKVKEISQWIETQNFDPRVDVTFRGQAEEQNRAQAFLMNAFLVALFLMAIILVTQFNSFYHAFLILTAVILSTIGVVIGLIVMERPFVIVMTGVGIISLAGIVVNNNIVLIDTFQRLMKTGMDPFDAIVRTGAQRLRPVLLTTFTTVVGLMPMFMQLSIDFVGREVTLGAPTGEFWVDLALAVVFGLTFATILTLLVTPCLIAAPYVLKRRFGAVKRKMRQRGTAPAE
ncbi:MAG: efflux RND transporter permease subunit [Alphaproteobacteria bacterium]